MKKFKLNQNKEKDQNFHFIFIKILIIYIIYTKLHIFKNLSHNQMINFVKFQKKSHY